MKLTVEDKKYIDYMIDNASERHPLELLAAFKGNPAFDIMTNMDILQEEWLEKFSEEDKKKAFLVVFIMTTVSKATLKNPSLKPKVSKKLLRTNFNIPNSGTVMSGYGYTSALGKKMLKLIKENKDSNLAS